MNPLAWKTFSPDAGIVVQGMTGKEGMRMTNWLLKSGMNVCAGVTPGKGGMVVEARPIFNSVSEAINSFPTIEITAIVVPSARVKGAVEEALSAGIKYIYILTESIPVHDVLSIRKQAADHGARVLGPSSVGYLQFPKFRIGYIGGENPFEQIREGTVGLVSTSGGMTNELMMGLARHNIGIRAAFAVGGDRIPGLSIEEALTFCDQLPEVKRLIVFAEPGRAFFNTLLNGSLSFSHPLTVFLAGDILDDLPRGKAYGHTGTLLQEEEQGVAHIRKALKGRGIHCVATMTELLTDLKSYV